MRPTLAYLICCSPRSGSTLLCEALEATGLAGIPMEYFDIKYHTIWAQRLKGTPGDSFIEKAIAAGTTSNRVFGAKVFWYQFVHMVHLITERWPRPSVNLNDALASVFPKLRYVWLRRSDILSQAVSYSIAMQTQKWRKRKEHLIEEDAAEFDHLQITQLLNQLRAYDEAWRNFFSTSGLVPFVVTYEELEASYELTLMRVLEFLGLTSRQLPLPRPSLHKQADRRSAEWVARYISITQAHG